MIDNFEEVNSEIGVLIDIANKYNNNQVVARMKSLVPEFKSMNSTFENLD